MCGISGCIVASAEQSIPQGLKDIVASQSARGPDSTDYLSRRMRDGRNIWLAHNRLSIIDLSHNSNQPMVSADGRNAIVFNGAIYNYVEIREELVRLGYQFRTSGDTEVLLTAFAHWGAGAFRRLIGMFALAIHDQADGSITLARDRFGVKPLYFWAGSGDFWFASTPVVLVSMSNSGPNLEYLSRGIRLKYYEDESAISPFDAISSLPPGCIATLGRGQRDVSVSPYYDLSAEWESEAVRLAGIGDREAEVELLNILRDATRIRLRADVPMGLSISGGVDSTAIAALCAETETDLTGFSFGDPADRTTEGQLVKLMGERLGMRVRFVSQSSGAEAKSLFWKTFRAQGAPFPHTSQMAQFAVFAAARAEGVKVMLGGQGGDEAFMGYRKYFLFHLRNVVEKRDWSALASMGLQAVRLTPAIAGKAGLFWRERGRYRDKGNVGLESGL